MLTRLAGYSPAVTFGGIMSTMFGLGWDALMHWRNPDLIEHESVFSLSNPAHVLFAVGLALIVLGSLLYLCGRISDSRASMMRRLSAVGLAFMLVLCSGSSFGIALATSGGHSHHEDTSTVTEAQRSAAAKLVSDSMTGATRFADFSVAQTEGYRQITPFRFGNMGPAHFHNQIYNSDGKMLDTTRPEDLIYYKKPSGDLVLLGVMYLAPIGEGPRVGGTLTHWHSHDNLCFNNQGMIVALKNVFGKCPNGTMLAGNTQEMLHVWFYETPDGPFSDNMTPGALAAAVKQATSK